MRIKQEILKYLTEHEYNDFKAEISYSMREGVLYATVNNGYNRYAIYDTLTEKVDSNAVRAMLNTEYLVETKESNALRKIEYVEELEKELTNPANGIEVVSYAITKITEKETIYSYESNGVHVQTKLHNEQGLTYIKTLTYQSENVKLTLEFKGTFDKLTVESDVINTMKYTSTGELNNIINVLNKISALYRVVPEYLVGSMFHEKINVGEIGTDLPDKFNFELQGIILDFPITHSKYKSGAQISTLLPEQTVSIGVVTDDVLNERNLTLYSNRMGYSREVIRHSDTPDIVREKVNTMLIDFQNRYSKVANMLTELNT